MTIQIIIDDEQTKLIGIEPLQASYSDNFLNLLSSLGEDMENPPIADLLRQYHQLEGQWVIATPMCWQATHNDAMLVSFGRDFNWTEEEAKANFNKIADFFSEEDIPLYYHDAYTWLMRVDDKPELHSKPIALMKNCSLMPVLESMDITMYWQRLFTELQMFLSSFSDSSNVAFNGLWFYGEGGFEADNIIPPRLVMSDDEQLINAFPIQIKRYNQELPADIIHIRHMTLEKENDFNKLKSEHDIYWFWNNIAYTTLKPKWWQSLIKRLTHAHKTTGNT